MGETNCSSRTAAPLRRATVPLARFHNLYCTWSLSAFPKRNQASLDVSSTPTAHHHKITAGPNGSAERLECTVSVDY
eukprot:5891606-Prymnesium_polylepis.1